PAHHFLTLSLHDALPILMTLATRAAMQAPRELHVIKWDFPPKFGNVTVNVVGDAGHNLAPYEFWKDHFPKAGITIKIIEVPFEGDRKSTRLNSSHEWISY